MLHQSIPLFEVDVQVLQCVFESLEESKRKEFVSALAQLLRGQALLRKEAYLNKLLEFEIDRTATSQVHTLFREETVVSGVLYEYARQVSTEHLARILKVIKDRISVPKLKESKVAKYVQRLLDAIFESTMPPELKQLCYLLDQCAASKFPLAKFSILSGFLFLRLYSPALLQPKFFLTVPNRNSTQSEVKHYEKKWKQRKVPLLQLTKLLQKVANHLSNIDGPTDPDPLITKNVTKFRKFIERVLVAGETDFLSERLVSGCGHGESNGEELPDKKRHEDFVHYHLKAIRSVESVLLVVDRKLRKDTSETSKIRREKLKFAVSIKTALEDDYNRLKDRNGLTRLASDDSIVRSISLTSISSNHSYSSSEGLGSGSGETLPSPTSVSRGNSRIEFEKRGNPKEWSCGDVMVWAETLNFPDQIKSSLHSHAVNGKVLLELSTHEQIEQTLGVTSFIDRKKFKAAVANLTPTG